MTFEISNETLLGFKFCDQEQKILMELFKKISDGFFSFPINLPGFAFYKVSTEETNPGMLITCLSRYLLYRLTCGHFALGLLKAFGVFLLTNE